MEQNVSIEEVLNNSFATIYDVLKEVDSNINDIVISNLNNNAPDDEILRLKQFNDEYIMVMQQTRDLQNNIIRLCGYINKDINTIKEEELQNDQVINADFVGDIAIPQDVAIPEDVAVTQEIPIPQDLNTISPDEVQEEINNNMDIPIDDEYFDPGADIVKPEDVNVEDNVNVEGEENTANKETVDVDSENSVEDADSDVEDVDSDEINLEALPSEVTEEAVPVEVSPEEIAGATSSEEVAADSNENVAEDAIEVAPEDITEAVNTTVIEDPFAPAEENSTDEASSVETPPVEDASVPEDVAPVADVPAEVSPEEAAVVVNSEETAVTSDEQNVQETTEVPVTEEPVKPEISFSGISENNAELAPINALGNDSGDAEVADNTTPVVTENVLKMYKATEDLPKVILVTNPQYDKLVQSLSTNKALLSAKGFFENDNIEQQLVQNGLLEGTVEDKQRKVNQLLAEAQELYKSGKANEAQEKMNQVAVLNEEIKNSTQQTQAVT